MALEGPITYKERATRRWLELAENLGQGDDLDALAFALDGALEEMGRICTLSPAMAAIGARRLGTLARLRKALLEVGH